MVCLLTPYEKDGIKEIINDYFHDETLELNLQFTRGNTEEAEKLVSQLSTILEKEYQHVTHKGFEWFFIDVSPDVNIEVNVFEGEKDSD